MSTGNDPPSDPPMLSATNAGVSRRKPRADPPEYDEKEIASPSPLESKEEKKEETAPEPPTPSFEHDPND